MNDTQTVAYTVAVMLAMGGFVAFIMLVCMFHYISLLFQMIF